MPPLPTIPQSKVSSGGINTSAQVKVDTHRETKAMGRQWKPGVINKSSTPASAQVFAKSPTIIRESFKEKSVATPPKPLPPLPSKPTFVSFKTLPPLPSRSTAPPRPPAPAPSTPTIKAQKAQPSTLTSKVTTYFQKVITFLNTLFSANNIHIRSSSVSRPISSSVPLSTSSTTTSSASSTVPSTSSTTSSRPLSKIIGKCISLIKNLRTLKTSSKHYDGDIPKPTTIKGRNQHTEIHHTFKVGDKEVGSEKTLRKGIKDARVASLEAKITYLNKQIEAIKDMKSKSPEDMNHQEACARELIACLKDLAKFQNSKNDWIGSNASRDVLVGKSFMKGREDILPGAVNHRTQTVTVDGQDVLTFHRYGAVWDPRNGLTNLQELTTFLSGVKSEKTKDVTLANIDRRIGEYEAMKKQYKSANQIKVINECIRTLQDLKLDPSNPNFKIAENFIGDRRRFLREQLLEPIKLQLQDNAAKLCEITNDQGEKKAIFPMFHLGLLTRTANHDFQASGWAHQEHNQIADMAQIFAELQNCKIVISDKHGGSFFGTEDEDGKAVLYLHPNDVGPVASKHTDIELQTCFMNVSVQGHNVNDGLQAEINAKSLKQLKKIALLSLSGEENTDKLGRALDKINHIETRLKAKESSFDLAADIAMVAKDVAALSEGCLSCKDRGGTIAELIAIRTIEQQRLGTDPSEQAKKAVKKDSEELVQKIFDADGTCVKVVDDCTGVLCAKVDYMQVPGLSNYQKLGNIVSVGVQFATGGLDVKPE